MPTEVGNAVTRVMNRAPIAGRWVLGRPVTRGDSCMRNGQAQPCLTACNSCNGGCRTNGLRLGRRVDRPTHQPNVHQARLTGKPCHPAAILGWPGKTRNKMRGMSEAGTTGVSPLILHDFFAARESDRGTKLPIRDVRSSVAPG